MQQHPPIRRGLREWGVLSTVSLYNLKCSQVDENPQIETDGGENRRAGGEDGELSRTPGVARSLRVHPKTLDWLVDEFAESPPNSLPMLQ